MFSFEDPTKLQLDLVENDTSYVYRCGGNVMPVLAGSGNIHKPSDHQRLPTVGNQASRDFTKLLFMH